MPAAPPELDINSCLLYKAGAPDVSRGSEENHALDLPLENRRESQAELGLLGAGSISRPPTAVSC